MRKRHARETRGRGRDTPFSLAVHECGHVLSHVMLGPSGWPDFVTIKATSLPARSVDKKRAQGRELLAGCDFHTDKGDLIHSAPWWMYFYLSGPVAEWAVLHTTKHLIGVPPTELANRLARGERVTASVDGDLSDAAHVALQSASDPIALVFATWAVLEAVMTLNKDGLSKMANALVKQKTMRPDDLLSVPGWKWVKLPEGEPPSMPDDQGIRDLLRISVGSVANVVATEGSGMFSSRSSHQIAMTPEQQRLFLLAEFGGAA